MEKIASYAVTEATSKGRAHPESPHDYRNCFQRDRDRIIHSTAFRRLIYKTQVFVHHEGDLYRTRLTHSIEVAQIARTLARELLLNEELVEAIALAHDLGHTPFGHAGQDALNKCMSVFGGFEHNYQSLRVVDHLEQRYPDFPGLNLTHETREGILKHCSKRRAATIGDLGQRFINNTQPTLEAQLVDLADSIAYNNHDLDDGLRSGLIKVNDLEESPFFYKIFSQAEQKSRQQDRMVAIYQSVRKIIDLMVTDLIDASRNNIKASKVETVEDVRGLKQPLITFSDALFKDHNQLKIVLRAKLYSHSKVETMYQQGEIYVSTIFNRLMENPEEMPERHQLICKKQEELTQKAGRAETVADYIAGMTDRYAISEYSRLS